MLPDTILVRRNVTPPDGFYNCNCVFDECGRFSQELPSRYAQFMAKAGFVYTGHKAGEFRYDRRTTLPATQREKYELKLEKQLGFF